MKQRQQLIFEQSVEGRINRSHCVAADECNLTIPSKLLRKLPAKLPEVSELQVVRHVSNLAHENFSIDTNFYPLGSCTMKYNPKVAQKIMSIPELAGRHPLAPLEHSQGYLQCLYELQQMLTEIVGMEQTSLCPMAGAQGELAGVLMIKAYHRDRGDTERCEMLVPDAAHGTNPASAVLAGFRVKEIPTKADGDIDLVALKQVLGPKTAGVMLTNPSTLGVFERNIKEVASMIHEAGGLLYYDGANLNALLGKVRPGDMGFDVLHLNLHKTFSTPHGTGGPGAGPVAANAKLAKYLPYPMVAKDNSDNYYWQGKEDSPDSIGRMSAFMGNAHILLRAYVYIRMLGRDGLSRVSDMAVLNANYLMSKLGQVGYELAYPDRKATHEFCITLKQALKKHGLNAKHFAKRLLDFKIHAPTMYFPQIVPECWLVEPTETESKEELDNFIAVLKTILQEAADAPEKLQKAPLELNLSRVDEARAARELDVCYQE